MLFREPFKIKSVEFSTLGLPPPPTAKSVDNFRDFCFLAGNPLKTQSKMAYNGLKCISNKTFFKIFPHFFYGFPKTLNICHKQVFL